MTDGLEMVSKFVDAARLAQFTFIDMARCAAGAMIGQFGFNPRECQNRVVASTPFWRLREYRSQRGPCLLIIPAPIKRHYIWDLSPAVSAVGQCLRHGLHVYLLEWLPASAETAALGLEDYLDAISAALDRIGREAEGATRPVLMGHSLGGTLAAILGALSQDSQRGLVLLSAPLCFEPTTSPFRDALVSIVPKSFSFDGEQTVPGSLLAEVSTLASPRIFFWERFRDAAHSFSDRSIWSTILSVERWALDEMALPGRLVDEILMLLYRENRLCRGTLTVRGRCAVPALMRNPALAVVNSADGVAPLASVVPFLAAMPASTHTRTIECVQETGVGLQHLSVLIGRDAHARIWPEILSWIADLD
jgi:polyhydroxyalkanoate synthase